MVQFCPGLICHQSWPSLARGTKLLDLKRNRKILFLAFVTCRILPWKKYFPAKMIWQFNLNLQMLFMGYF